MKGSYIKTIAANTIKKGKNHHKTHQFKECQKNGSNAKYIPTVKLFSMEIIIHLYNDNGKYLTIWSK